MRTVWMCGWVGEWVCVYGMCARVRGKQATAKSRGGKSKYVFIIISTFQTDWFIKWQFISVLGVQVCIRNGPGYDSTKW